MLDLNPPPPVLLSSFQGAQATDECLSQLWVIFPGLDKSNSALLSLYITLIPCSCSRFTHASACSRAKRRISHFSIFRCCSCSTLINPVSRTRIIVRAWDFPFLSSNLAVTIQTESSPLRNISHRSVDVSLADCNFLPHYPRTGRQVCVVLHVTQRN